MQSFPVMGNVGGPTRTRTWDQWIRLCPAFLPGADYLITLAHVLAGRDEHAVGCGTLEPVIKDALGTVAESSGSLCTFRRCTAGLAQGCRVAPSALTGSLNSSRSSSALQRKRTFSGRVRRMPAATEAR